MIRCVDPYKLITENGVQAWLNASATFRADAPGNIGEIRDEETGRCIAVRDCSVALAFNPGGVPSGGLTFGEAVLDACGSECSGKAKRGRWSHLTVSFRTRNQ